MSSLPVRGAWIEIFQPFAFSACFRSLPVRGAWIEIFQPSRKWREKMSLPVRGAWIEIFLPCQKRQKDFGRSPCGERGLKFSPFVRARGS